MIFEPLHESNQRGEFFGAMCHWHKCKRDDPRRKIEAGQITIREIIVEQSEQGQGQGKIFVERLRRVSGVTSIFARCPADLPANDFYQALGFQLEGQETARSGRKLNLWRLRLSPTPA